MTIVNKYALFYIINYKELIISCIVFEMPA